MAKNSRLKRGGQLLGCMDAPAITGLAQAGRLYYAVALYRRTTEFSLLLLYQIPLAVHYYYYIATRPRGLGALTILNSLPFLGVVA